MKQFQGLFVKHLDTSQGQARASKWLLKRKIRKRMMKILKMDLTAKILRKSTKFTNLRYCLDSSSYSIALSNGYKFILLESVFSLSLIEFIYFISPGQSNMA